MERGWCSRGRNPEFLFKVTLSYVIMMVLFMRPAQAVATLTTGWHDSLSRIWKSSQE
jgi:hypothetical protein